MYYAGRNMKALDLTGQTFNYLTVLNRDYDYQKQHNSQKSLLEMSM